MRSFVLYSYILLPYVADTDCSESNE